MDFSPLKAISPVDGRYRSVAEPLAAFFTEEAIIRLRVMVEVEYFLALCRIPLPQLIGFPFGKAGDLQALYLQFTEHEAEEVKAIEKVTNHDVKAVEYYLRKKFDELDLSGFKEFIHFGLTSQDINNVAFPLALKGAFESVLNPVLEEILETLKIMSDRWKSVPMLARTHGQPASPTLLGKEIYVFAERLQAQLAFLRNVPFSAKFGGATGNLNAHFAAYPQIRWVEFAHDFIHDIIGLERLTTTTQIEHYDNFAAFCDALKRINTIFTDLDRDMWLYISMDYFKQQIKAGEVGSSAMPHKVNPIDFENSEGNLGLANAILEHLSAKLPVSRLQRDLTDSTVIRNTGVPLAHSLIAYRSLLKGLSKLILNEEKLHADLENNWQVVAEAIQSVLRREGYPEPYEALKQLTRTNQRITRETIARFIDGLEVDNQIKEELKKITPENYTGKWI